MNSEIYKKNSNKMFEQLAPEKRRASLNAPFVGEKEREADLFCCTKETSPQFHFLLPIKRMMVFRPKLASFSMFSVCTSITINIESHSHISQIVCWCYTLLMLFVALFALELTLKQKG